MILYRCLNLPIWGGQQESGEYEAVELVCHDSSLSSSVELVNSAQDETLYSDTGSLMKKIFPFSWSRSDFFHCHETWWRGLLRQTAAGAAGQVALWHHQSHSSQQAAPGYKPSRPRRFSRGSQLTTATAAVAVAGWEPSRPRRFSPVLNTPQQLQQ